MATLYSNVDATESSLVLIESQVLGVAAASVTFSAIPQTYKSLRIVYINRGTATDSARNGQVQFNGDTDDAANYRFGQTVGGSGTGNYSGTGAQVLHSPGTLTSADFWATGVLDFPYYTSTTQHKTILARNCAIRSTSLKETDSRVAMWDDTSAITSILLKITAGNFLAGSQFDLYGVK